MNIEELNEAFGIEAEVGLYEEEGMGFIMVSNKHAEATICLYGAQILSYNPLRNVEILWMSPTSRFEKGKAIRGGVPVCFPWFGPHESDNSLPQHGFARILDWELNKTESLPGGETRLTLQLSSSEQSKKYWNCDFCAQMIFTIGAKLEISLKVSNTSAIPIAYTCALHSYFSVSAIENIGIDGLKDTPYENQLDGGDYVQKEEILRIDGEITRHYYNTETTCTINDPAYNRSIQIEKEGSKNTTVWNPGADTCAQMDDMPDEAFETFICLETVNKIDDIIELDSGESHTTTAQIRAF